MSSSPFLQVDRTKSQALYRQIAEQICLQISDGRLPVGTQLPTVRHIAESLGVTRVTAQTAYSELQTSGWVEAVVGRGTFVAAVPHDRELIKSLSGQVTADSVMYNIDRIGKITGLRSFAYAEPDPALFPTDFWYSVTAQAETFASLMQYGPAQGDEALRIEIVTMLAEMGITAMPDDLLITAGVSEGLAIVAQALGTPGGCVVVEQPVYVGMLNVLNTYGLRAVGIPVDSEGMRVDLLEQVIETHHPCFVYVATRYQNPTGASLSEKRRSTLMALAQRYHLPIVEDDTYGQLGLDVGEQEAPLPLKAIDPADLVIYLNGFSKVLMPGLRIGYMIAPPALRQRLITMRQTLDLTGPTFLQHALANFLHRGRFKVHLRRVIPHYRERRNALLQALSAEMPSDVQWTKPRGGMCCWLTVPRSLCRDDFYHEAIEQGVAFTPGDVFLITPDEDVHLRLCFSGLSPEAIYDGVAILARLMRTAPYLRRLTNTICPRPLV